MTKKQIRDFAKKLYIASRIEYWGDEKADALAKWKNDTTRSRIHEWGVGWILKNMPCWCGKSEKKAGPTWTRRVEKVAAEKLRGTQCEKTERRNGQ